MLVKTSYIHTVLADIQYGQMIFAEVKRTYRPNVDNGRQFQHILDRRLGGIQSWRLEQCHVFGHFHQEQ